MKNAMTLALVLTLTLALPATAAPCYTTSAADVDTGDLAEERLYVAIDNCIPVVGCAFSIWVYQETNGIDGLQRRDEVRSDVGACGDGTEPDTVVF